MVVQRDVHGARGGRASFNAPQGRNGGRFVHGPSAQGGDRVCRYFLQVAGECLRTDYRFRLVDGSLHNTCDIDKNRVPPKSRSGAGSLPVLAPWYLRKGQIDGAQSCGNDWFRPPAAGSRKGSKTPRFTEDPEGDHVPLRLGFGSRRVTSPRHVGLKCRYASPTTVIALMTFRLRLPLDLLSLLPAY